MKTDLIKNEDGTYTLTLEQIQWLSDGTIKLINGHIYINAEKIPASTAVVPGKANLVNLSLHPPFDRPTQSQIEQLKKFPELPEIKGVHLKSSKLSSKTQTAVLSLITKMETRSQDHPFTWVQSAEMLSNCTGEDSTKPLLLEILNSAIPLKEGMKLEGFSAKEFDKKYLHSRPSLLETWTANYQPTLNKIDAKTHENLGPIELTAEDLIPRPIDMDNLLVEDPTYIETQMPLEVRVAINQLDGVLAQLYSSTCNKSLESWEEFRNTALDLSTDYENAVNLKGTYTPEDNWEVGLQLQDWFWDCFRGYTITIIRLFNIIDPLRDERYDLTTPIIGMKKR